MAREIHPTAVVDRGAELDDDVRVGPYCVVGEGVRIGKGTHLIAQVTVLGPSELGARNQVFPFAVLGGAPQDRGYRGEPTRLSIGDDNVIREHVTVHRGTTKQHGVTRVGSDTMLMVGVHVAHDVIVEDHVTLTNATMLGGHVHVGAWAATGGGVAVAPFVRIGESAFLAGGAMVERDVPPFLIAAGDRATVRAVNRVGLIRRGAPEASRAALKKAFRMLYRSAETREQALALVESELGGDPWVARLVRFIRESQTARG
jgi:UDP-N-acetylglucosamine acyltransferase